MTLQGAQMMGAVSMEAFCTMIVPAAHVATARAVTFALSSRGHGMLTTGCNAAGSGTPTHWISSGYVDSDFVALLSNPSTLFSMAQANAVAQGGSLNVTLPQLQAALTASDIGAEPPFEALARLGLKIVSE